MNEQQPSAPTITPYKSLVNLRTKWFIFYNTEPSVLSLNQAGSLKLINKKGVVFEMSISAILSVRTTFAESLVLTTNDKKYVFWASPSQYSSRPSQALLADAADMSFIAANGPTINQTTVASNAIANIANAVGASTAVGGGAIGVGAVSVGLEIAGLVKGSKVVNKWYDILIAAGVKKA